MSQSLNYQAVTLPCSEPQQLHYGQNELTDTLTTSLKTGLHCRICTPPGVSLQQLVDAIDLPNTPKSGGQTIAFDGDLGQLVQSEPPPEEHASEPLWCSLLNYQTLFGHLSYRDDNWHFTPGLLWQAANRFVFIDAAQLLNEPRCADALIATLQSGHIQLQFHGSNKVPAPLLPSAQFNGLVALHGTASELYELAECYPQLATVLPLHVELRDRIHHQQAPHYLGYLTSLLQQQQVTITDCGLQALAQYASKLAEHNHYFSLEGSKITALIREIKTDNQTEIAANDVAAALVKRQQRIANLSQASYQDFIDGSMLLDVTGSKVGQINGLTVVDIGDISYGEPVRITASVHYGDGDVIDIERKAELAGNIHAKGTMILAAYVSQIFAKDAPLHLSANIVFEQSYYEVDGDSASLAELVALLSAIGRIPVHQHMAVTGAIDQFGNVQSIGGINQKVEGFWSVASQLAPEQVISIVMPKSNLLQFNPDDAVRQAITDGRLKICCVSHVSEAIEILTGMKSGIGEEDRQQRYPLDTVYGRVQLRLLDLADPLESTSLSWLQKLKYWLKGDE
ncbi:AAA family ATPase [Neiella sp. HB171785]|uniref:endopeptidase La n=1 Tax=Neiella litorisoli TaxID=2771431 RepID=A0A8J6QQT9_9GAMM|nr:S16 family serine protease [Neiella litorisoli]MBD1389661.1 AAA family ATPase [Neiella litorisoli]